MTTLKKITRASINIALCLSLTLGAYTVVSFNQPVCAGAAGLSDSKAEQTAEITQEPESTVEKLIPKEQANPYEMPDQVVVKGKVHTPNSIPDDVDINELDPSSLYAVDMIRRYCEGTSSEKEKRALIVIAEKAKGIFIDHPKHGFIEVGQQLRAELNISAGDPLYNASSEKRAADKAHRQEYLTFKFQKKTISEEELSEYKQICDEEGYLVHGLHLFYMNPEIQAMYDEVKDQIKIEIKTLDENDPSLSYMSVDDYALLVKTYNEKYITKDTTRRTYSTDSVPLKRDFTEEEKVITDENSPYLHHLIALYLEGRITDEEKAILDEAMELYGLVIVGQED